MAYAILGTPKPAFFDSSGAPLASGTLTVQDPDDSSAKDVFPTADDANAGTNAISTAITLDARGEPESVEVWGIDGEDYKVILKDSTAATIYTIDDIRLPNSPTFKVKTADEALTSSTLADDTHLAGWILPPDRYYAVTGYLKVTADAGARDLEMNFDSTTGLQEEQYTWITVDAGNALAVDQGETQALTSAVPVIDIDGASRVGIIINGFIQSHSTSTTTIDMQFANQAGTGTVTVERGSWVKFELLAAT